LERIACPFASTNLPPNWVIHRSGTFSYLAISGSSPSTFSVPFGLRTVSFFASAASSEIVCGGCVMPAFLKRALY